MEAVLISGSPSAASKSRQLLERAKAQLEAGGCASAIIELNALPADALLGRRSVNEVKNALSAVTAAPTRIVVASSPTYRATYSGLLKTFFDLLPPDSLKGKIGIPLLTGGSLSHQLAVDHAFRPLFASLGATVGRGVYGYDAQFKNGPDPALLAEVDAAVEEAMIMAERIGVIA
jgi:FMN reductase